MEAWDIYEITADQTPIHGVMLRGRLRKFGLHKGFSVLTENASDKKNCVRFAVLTKRDAENVTGYVHSVVEGAQINQVASSVQNPVLSKLQVNDASRYTL